MTTADARLALSAIQVASSSCSTATWSEASMLRVRFLPGTPSSSTTVVSGTAVAHRITLCSDDRREAGQVVLVVLLHAVLANARRD